MGMTSQTTAALFPGQGTNVAGLREEIAGLRPDLVELLDDVTGVDAFGLSTSSTRFAQPAIVCASLARWAVIPHPPADIVLGHSLGEISSLAAAGVLSANDAIRLAARRGELMDAAAQSGEPGGMTAVLKGSIGEVKELAERHGLIIANDNAPGQVVVSGAVRRLDALEADATGAGLRAIRLAVAGAFHSPAMRSVRGAYAEAIAELAFAPASIPVWSSMSAGPMDDPAAALLDALEHPVRFRESLLALREAGITDFFDAGPGEVLSGMVRRTLPDREPVHV
jgi:[acyl-carrier-protein] S-malonyltransferase